MGLPPSAEPTSPRGLFPGNEEASVRSALARVIKGDVIRGDSAIQGEDEVTPARFPLGPFDEAARRGLDLQERLLPRLGNLRLQDVDLSLD